METTATKIEVAPMAPGAVRRQVSPITLLEKDFERLYTTVYRYLVHRLFDRELAEELAAETFYKAVGAVGRLGADERQVQMWLLRIATNLANQHYRRARLRRLLLGRFATAPRKPGAVDPASDGDDPRRDKARAVLQELPSKY